MPTRAIAELQESVDALRAALKEGDWDSCEIELDSGETIEMSRAEAREAITEGETEMRRLRLGLN